MKRVVGPRHHGTSSLVVHAPITPRLFHNGFAVGLWDEDRVIVVTEELGALAMHVKNDEVDALQETKPGFVESAAFPRPYLGGIHA